MKLPVSWLKKYIDISWTPERIADALTMSGTKVEGIEKSSGEAVIEIEVTTNRPDCLSVLGLAREVAVLTGKKIKPPKISTAVSKKNFPKKAVQVIIEDKKGCPKYTARLIEGVAVQSSPQEIQKCLEWMGARPINNAVDATNFVLFEMGQPLHAFDFDKLAGGKIIVRRAKSGEKFLGIDGIEYTLDEKTLVIADTEKPVAIAGVMGGKLTEVTDHTKNILLESAFFDLGLVRQASRKYKLSTDSSYRFERGVDPQNVPLASARAKDLIIEWAGGSEAGPMIEKGDSKGSNQKNIVLRISRVEALIGIAIPASKIMSILKSLGFQTKPGGKDKIRVAPNSARRDIVIEADLAEEILRIEGFDKVPAAIPVTHHSETQAEDAKATGILELKKYLSGIGLKEIITYSLIPERFLMNSAFTDLTRAQKITNPTSADQEYLRPLLLPGTLQTILFNTHRKAASLKLFEIGNRYVDGNEETVVAVSLHGNLEEHWKRKTPVTFYDLKGIIETTLRFLKVKNYEWRENEPCPKYENSSSLHIGGQRIGTLGILDQQLLKNWDITHEVVYAELVLNNLFKRSSEQETPRVKTLPKYPSVRRDIAFIIDEKVSIQSLEILMKQSASPLLKETHLFDEYAGKNIAPGKRSLAFSLAYQKETGTFTDEEINALQSKVGEALKNTYHVEFR
jgi:phenylalanyl-tRNA synthetase beta chain